MIRERERRRVLAIERERERRRISRQQSIETSTTEQLDENAKRETERRQIGEALEVEREIRIAQRVATR